MNGMTENDVKLVDFPYPDDWYDDEDMLMPMVNPSWWQLKRDHKHDLAFRPLETALLEGKGRLAWRSPKYKACVVRSSKETCHAALLQHRLSLRSHYLLLGRTRTVAILSPQWPL